MICPVCGAETSGDVCTSCGARLGGTSSFTLSGNQPVGAAAPTYNDMQQPMDAYSDLNDQPYNASMNGYPSYPVQPPKKSKSGLISGIVVLVIILAAVAGVGINILQSKKAVRECEKVIDTYMAGLQEADVDKVISTVDPESNEVLDDDSLTTLTSTFTMLKSMGVEYTIEYSILSHEKASESEIKGMCASAYGDAGMSKEVKRAYIFEVEMTMEASYLGQTENSTETQDMICYEKDGHYYIGGVRE